MPASPLIGRHEAEAAFQGDHSEARARRLAALVALGDPCAGERLRLVLDGENAEPDGKLWLRARSWMPARALLADMPIVRRLAADDAAERDVAVEMRPCAAPGRGRGKADRGGNLEGARHGDALIGGPACSITAVAPFASSAAMCA